MIARRLRRGFVLFRILYLASAVVAGVALIVPGGCPWAIAAFAAGILFYFFWSEAGKHGLNAQNVCQNPQLVYWVHPVAYPVLQRNLFRRSAENRRQYMLLHLRDGTELEVTLLPDQMEMFIDWLTERNPSVRIGDYDNGTKKR